MVHIAEIVDKLSRLGHRLTPYTGKKYAYSVKGKVVDRGAAPDLKKREAALKKRWPTGRIIPLRDTYIRFNPNNGEILESRNVASLTQSSTLNFTVVFASDFPTAHYVFQVGANGDVRTQVLEQFPGSIRINFQEPCPDIVDINFY